MPTTTTRTTAGAARTKAARQWRDWAASMADGGPAPAPLEVLEAGAVLGLREPMAALEADVEAIGEVRQIETQTAALRAKFKAQRAEHGDGKAIRERMGELRRELRHLEALLMPSPHMMTVGKLDRDASIIRERHPTVFATGQPAKGRRGAGA
jgi:hypothetical protein